MVVWCTGRAKTIIGLLEFPELLNKEHYQYTATNLGIQIMMCSLLIYLLTVIPIFFKKGRKDEPGEYRPVSLTSVSGKIVEQILKGVICKQLKDTSEIWGSQCGFLPNRSWPIILISFFDRLTNTAWRECY